MRPDPFRFNSKFGDIGILKEITGQSRNRKFSYESYIHLFHEDGGEN